MDFLEWYKNKIESAEEELPAGLWNDVQNDLDIDMVYTRLAKSLKKNRRRVWLWKASAAASLISLVSLGTILYFSSTTSKEPVAGNEQISISDSTLIKYDQPVFSQSVKKDSVRIVVPEDTEKKEYIAALTDSHIKIQSVKVLSPTIKNIPDSVNDDQEIPILKTGIEFPHPAASGFSLPATEYVPIVNNLSPIKYGETVFSARKTDKIFQKNIAFSTVTVAITGEFTNTWLLNTKTIEGLDPQNFTSTRPTFTSNFGFSLATNINEGWDLVSKLNLARRNGQSYNEYIQGKYVSNSIDLNYIDIALMGRYKPFRKNRDHAFSAGVYTAFLQNASQNIDGITTNITSDYSNTDFGIISGYEYQMPLSDYFSLNTGFFYRIGLRNIFTGNHLISKNLNKSVNTSLNFSLSIGYTIPL